MPTYSDPGYIADVVGTSGRIEATWGNAVRDRLVHRFASVAARDAAITFPSEGMCCYVTAENAFYMHDGTRWLAWDSDWATFTTTLSFSGGGGAVGNASITALKMRRGGSCLVAILFTWGSTTSAGTGAIQFSLPFTASANTYAHGVGNVTDTGTATHMCFPIVTPSNSNLIAYTNASPVGTVTGTSPVTLATNDTVFMQVEYQRATYGADEV